MEPTPDAARAIARAAYIFLYPLVVNYGAAYEMAIEPRSARDGFGRAISRGPIPTAAGGFQTQGLSLLELDPQHL